MENYHLPFKTGMDWLRGACVVVKRAPATVFGILGCYVLALFVANLPSELLGLSWLGAILSSLVTPFGALAFAACGRELARNSRPTLFSCFGEGWNDMDTRNKLILLGLIYGLCVIVIGLIVSLLTSGDIAQWKNAQGQIDPQSVLSHIPWLGFIVGAVLYAMLLGITCFSPMLIAWEKTAYRQSLLLQPCGLFQKYRRHCLPRSAAFSAGFRRSSCLRRLGRSRTDPGHPVGTLCHRTFLQLSLSDVAFDIRV